MNFHLTPQSFWLQFIDKASVFNRDQVAKRYEFMDFQDGSNGELKSLSFNEFGWRQAAQSNEKHGVVCESEVWSRIE